MSGKIAKWVVGAVLALLAIAMAGMWLLDTSIGHRFVVDRIARLRPASGLRFSIGRIEGSLYSDARLIDVRVYDKSGQFLSVPNAELGWAPFEYLSNRLQIRRLVVPRATLVRLPKLVPTGKRGPILPGFDIHVGELRIDRLALGAAVAGTPRVGRVHGRADIRAGRALVDLRAVVAGSDTLTVKLDAEPDRDKFDVDAHAKGIAGGVLSRFVGAKWPVSMDVTGVGRWSAWHGTAKAEVGPVRVIDLALSNKAGAYTLLGDIVPETITHGKVARMTAGGVHVDGAGQLTSRRLDGRLSLRSRSLAVETTGVLDLAVSAYRNVRIKANLLQPKALFPNMSGRNIELRAILDGTFATAAFDYRLSGERVAFDDTGFESVRAGGKGHFSKAPVLVPITLTARQVTGVGDVAGGILRNLLVTGTLKVTAKELTGDDLRLKSDKLTSRITLIVDLDTGKFEVGLNGQLGRYLIPGIGLVDVTSKLRVVPGPNGHGTRVVGTGTAQVLRLDNAFFRSLAGGLPRIVTGLERTPDGILHFTNLVLSAPSIRLAGTGYRRRDGSFHFEGSGRQATYGPVILKLDGRIEKPTIDLVLASPMPALSLTDVRAHLDPVAEGFAFKVEGGSRLGPFSGDGVLRLPPGGTATIAIARLDVSGSRGTGELQIVDGGFEGKIGVSGGGLGGELLFRPVGDIQRIEMHLDATAAKLESVSVRKGRLDAVLLLDPAGVSIDATATATGLRSGGLSLARFAGTAKLRGGVGEVRGSIAGSRGRAFDVQAIAQVSPDKISLVAQGTVDRRPLKLDSAAVFTREDDGWQLAPTKLSFAGGAAEVSGRMTGADTTVDASLTAMPLSILDIGYPGLGLGGSASGKMSFTQGSGAPVGRVDMTVRGLSRAGLVLSSRPLDVGIAAVLQPDKAALRAVMASGGKTIGRAQAQLSPLGQGGLAQRLSNAALFAQLRYDGPADTLWRLTGIELFDLSGPVAVAADMTGRVNDPQIRGVVQAKGARIESAVTGTVLTNVQASGSFGGSKLTIVSFAADAGKGGRVTGTGTFDLAAVNGFGMDLKLDAQNAVVINRDDIGGTATGPLTVRSDGSGGVIAGDLRLSASRFRLGQAAAAAAVPQLNIREINLPFGSGVEDDAPRKPWSLDIRAKAPDNLRVSGLGLDSEWSANLEIRGTPEAPKITGRADLVRGSYEFAGRDFELERGIIRFDGSVPSNPALDISANGNASDLSATIRVTGTSQKPEIAFTSVPSLPQEELLSRLLFGTSITNLSAPEALQLASAVAALNSSGGGLDPINAVRRATGLDRLRVLPADKQTGQGTSIAAGKYLTRRIFAEIITDGQGYSATQVEFQITRWLSLLSSVSTIGRQSANVRVSKDY